MEIDYWYSNGRTISSYTAGITWGTLFYSGYPNLTRDHLIQFTNSLRLKAGFDKYAYQLGFIRGYTVAALGDKRDISKYADINKELSGYNVTTSREKETTVGKVTQAKEAARVEAFGHDYPWTSAKVLENHKVVFCIKSVRGTTQRDGATKWLLEIEVPSEMITVTGANVDGLTRFTVDRLGKNGEPTQRDITMSKLRTLIMADGQPAHGAMFDRLPLEGGRSYLDIVEIDGICACGEIVGENSETEGGDDLTDDLENPF